MASTSEHINDSCALLVRPGFEADLIAELGVRASMAASMHDAGIVVAAKSPEEPLVFERQRMPDARFVPDEETKPIGESLFSAMTGTLRASSRPWATHVFATDSSLQDRAQGFARALERLIKRSLPDLGARQIESAGDDDELILQICRTTKGVWYSTAPSRALSSLWVGGIPRLRDDPHAPSRSFLKLEEAFCRLQEWPEPGQYAVDLGAAPGGWTLALARRGCHVMAVDNGPLRLPPPPKDWGRIEYVRANGITFESRKPVDWLVADMLVAPGVALGLLRRWIEGRKTRRLVVNIKIPQQDAFRAVEPVLNYLKQVGTSWRFEVRQLYHDRREVTVMGRRRD